MITELLSSIVKDLQDAFANDERVVVSSDRLALSRKIPDADRKIYLDAILTSLDTEQTAKRTVQYSVNVDLRIAARVRNENEISAMVSFTDSLQRRLSRGWTADGFTLQSLQWQGIDRIADISDVYITYLSFTFVEALYE